MIPLPTSPRFKDLTGQVFNRLTVVSYAGKDVSGAFSWLCKCSCGCEITTRGSSLKYGSVQSCGCYRALRRKESNITHGMSGGYLGKHKSIYGVWAAMLQRCNNPKDASYHNYGGRGIQVCSSWESFEVFMSDMGERPSAGHSIDRIDNNGNYCKENCRWATKEEQTLNRRPERRILLNRIFTFNGYFPDTLVNWATFFGKDVEILMECIRGGKKFENLILF